ncbi:MAG: HIT domain-containing protein [Rhodovibrionaceae bacterium]|nr:HIT domain-containing protein [Rhodovibrionaceae bacterium]
MTDSFELNERLASDSFEVDDLDLCQVRLMNDSHYPWLILVPQRPGLTELHDLSEEDLSTMTQELVKASRALESVFKPDKINIAALGNEVAQLHVHVIARFQTDAAWPGPVWGVQPAKPYQSQELDDLLVELGGAFVDY